MVTTPARPRRRGLKWLVGGIAVAVLALVVGPFVYINFISEDPEPRLELTTPTSSATTTPAPGTTEAPAPDSAALTGTWVVGDGSTAGYRVDEVLFGQDNTATGRTSDVSGTMTIAGSTVTDGTFSVQLANVESGDDRRDNQFRGRIMDVAQFPTADFELTEPIDLPSIPAAGEKITVAATGALTLRGTTNAVTVELEAQRIADGIEVLGTVPITFADYGIPNPSRPGITTKDNGEMEFLLEFSRE
jgi:polyisoprenoid-binding protein YceI